MSNLFFTSIRDSLIANPSIQTITLMPSLSNFSHVPDLSEKASIKSIRILARACEAGDGWNKDIVTFVPPLSLVFSFSTGPI